MLHRLWPLAGRRRARLVHGLGCCTVVVCYGLLTLLTHPAVPAVFVAATAGAVCAAGLRSWLQPWPQPKRLLPYRRMRLGSSCLGTGSSAGVALMTAVLVVVAEQLPSLVGAPGLLVLGAVAGVALLFGTRLLEGATSAPVITTDHDASDPRNLLRGDFLSGLLAAVVFALAIGISAGATGESWFALALGLISLLAAILVANAWTRYVVLLLCTRGRLPWRLGAFLNWAYGAGLLRISGNAYQFRHRELQDWLARHAAR
ncbi:hypothetical protein [Streptomyces flaveus]|uniref:hypothetical protein n=1 Tax=Streptomyces flaveus TaxID=66370 RepID=UPI003328E59C